MPELTSRAWAEALYEALKANLPDGANVVIRIERQGGQTVECRGGAGLTTDAEGVNWVEGSCQVEVPQDATRMRIYIVHRYNSATARGWRDWPILIVDEREVTDQEKGRTVRYRVRVKLGVLGSGEKQQMTEEQGGGGGASASTSASQQAPKAA